MGEKRVKIPRVDQGKKALLEAPLPEPTSEIRVRETRYDDGRIKSREHGYIDGAGNFVLHGKRTYWDENGQRSAEGEFVDGKPDGIFREWHGNGQIQTEDTYEGGELSGFSLERDENGTLKRRAEYHKGNLHGSVLEYGEEENLLLEEQYREGEKHGRSIQYYSEGGIFVEMTYVDDKPHGLAQLYAPDGAELARTTYDHGKIVSRQIDQKFARILEKMASAPRPKRKPLV